MKLTPQNIIHHELIGLDAKVVDSTNKSLIGIEGQIIDETRNILTIEDGGQDKNIPKSCSSFMFTLPDTDGKRYLLSRIKVDGRLLLSQPENRIQTKFRKRFRK
ncbi:Ribonuclease P protein component 1 [uncultured archaeon]|nr:Ribonuclease P protein component 1 [uncultured archaeon]